MAENFETQNEEAENFETQNQGTENTKKDKYWKPKSNPHPQDTHLGIK